MNRHFMVTGKDGNLPLDYIMMLFCGMSFFGQLISCPILADGNLGLPP